MDDGTRSQEVSSFVLTIDQSVGALNGSFLSRLQKMVLKRDPLSNPPLDSPAVKRPRKAVVHADV